MKRLTNSLLLAVLTLAGAQTAPATGTVPFIVTRGNPDPLAVRNFQRLSAPPTLLSNSVQDAANAILNENIRVDGVIGPLPQVLAAALERTAIRTPVRLLLARGGQGQAYRFVRARALLVNAGSPAESTIVTTTGVIVVQAGRVSLLRAPLVAASVAHLVDQTMNPPAR